MRVQEHLDKITWSLADKFLYVVYGFVTLFQMNSIDTAEYGLFSLLMAIHTMFFVITDAFALQSIVQFGQTEENRKKVNTIALILHVGIVMTCALSVYLLKSYYASIFKEPRLIEIANILPLFCFLTIPRTYCLKFIYQKSKMNWLFFVNFALFGTLSILTVYLIKTKSFLTFNDMLSMYLFAHALSSLVAVILTFKYLQFSFKGKIKFIDILKFGIPLLLTNTLNSLPKQMDSYVIQFFFNSSITGIYQAAKTLFRVFDETVNAAVGLVYPAAIRQFNNKNMPALNDLMTKAVSFIFVGFMFIIIILQSGFSSLLIKTFLKERYFLAIPQFNLMMWGALGLALSLLTSIILAYNKPVTILKYVIISIIFSGITFYITGTLGNPTLIPLGGIVYYASLGLLSYNYSRINFDFKPHQLFRAIKDSRNYIKVFKQKSMK